MNTLVEAEDTMIVSEHKPVLSENHPVIVAIQNSEKITDEDKLLALAELQALDEKGLIGTGGFNPNGHDVDDLFEWDHSDQPSAFWAYIQDKVFTPEKRTC